MEAKSIRKAPTLRDVSAAAGVSLITVSRALRRPDSVHSSTRKRVEDAIQAVGYVPNLTARSLVSQRSHIVGAIVPVLRSSLFSSAIQGLMGRLQAARLQLLVGASERSTDVERELVEAFVGRQADALVLTGFMHAEGVRERLRNFPGPVVETFNLRDDPIDLCVGYDNYAAAFELTTKLAARGYKRIALVGDNFENNDQALDRYNGFLTAMRQSGLTVRRQHIVKLPQPTTPESGRLAIRQLLATRPRPDLVFFHAELPAVAALLDCIRSGLSVPGDIAIAGFGDLEFSADLPVPLTTVRVKGHEIGERTADLITMRLKGEPTPANRVDVGFDLMLRESA